MSRYELTLPVRVLCAKFQKPWRSFYFKSLKMMVEPRGIEPLTS
jgi:hypothetical protein